MEALQSIINLGEKINLLFQKAIVIVFWRKRKSNTNQLMKGKAKSFP